ncbi:Guanosine-5'-triphosphate,3'-diphosphate pyrophosphatase [bacterium HR41]|nr:Guanosine-5'-triphosphate,3'-diphosphate pyrophosphatase [bacterium HR41]
MTVAAAGAGRVAVPSATVRVAVIDIGTNSTRLLVADASGSELREVARANRVTRLGAGLDASGALGADAIARTVTVARDYVRDARALGAARTVAVATQAVREARNREAFVRALAEATGLALRVLSGEEEACLTFLGATTGLTPAVNRGSAQAAKPPSAEPTVGSQSVAVVDVGGGSTEIVTGLPGRSPTFAVSLPLGVVRHSERYLAHDPPRASELEALAADARTRLAEALAAPAATSTRPAASPDGGAARGVPAVGAAIAVAGTATSLAAIDQRLDPYDPARVHGYTMSLARARELTGRLAELPLAERRKVPGLHPDRAATIVAGGVLLTETLSALGVERFTVSEHDLLHGIAHAIAPETGATTVEFAETASAPREAGL